MKRPEQYVGISGGVKAEQQREVAEIAREVGVDQLGAFVMWGIQASNKTQIEEIPTRYGEGWHSVGDDIRNAGFKDETALTRAYPHIYGGDSSIFLQRRTIEATVERTKGFHEGVQLNCLDWHKQPDYDQFMDYLRDLLGSETAMVLQCHQRVMDELNPAGLAERLKELKPEYVLFDVSHGQGKTMNLEDVDNYRDYIDAIYQAQLGVGVVVAGGLSANTLHGTVGPLFQEFSDLSCDAESRLRSGQEGETYLDMDRAAAYLEAWAEMVDG